MSAHRWGMRVFFLGSVLVHAAGLISTAVAAEPQQQISSARVHSGVYK